MEIKEAKETNSTLSLILISQEEKVQTVFINYCQNLNLPHLGTDQLDDA